MFTVLANTSIGTPFEKLLQEHEKNFTQLGHFRAKAVGDVFDKTTGKFQLSWEEIWVHAGPADRFTSKTYQYYDSNDKLVVQETPLHLDVSHDDREVRILYNWDSEQTIALPLRPGGKNASLFATIKGQIYPRDPSNSHPSPLLAAFLFRPDYVHALADLVKSAKDVKVSNHDQAPIIDADLPDKHLQCTLSPSHGYLISRCQSFAKDKSFISDIVVQEFTETATGAWFPSLAFMKNDAGEIIMRARLIEATHGSSITEKDATVQFPEGARVDNPVEKVIHIWGPKDGPIHSFDSFDDFRLWEDEAARANAPSVPSPRTWRISAPVFWANVVLIGLILVLLYLRKCTV